MNAALISMSDWALFDVSVAALFKAIAEAHDFDLKNLTPSEVNLLGGFLAVAAQTDYPVSAAWPEKVFLSVKLSCHNELQRAKQTHMARSAEIEMINYAKAAR